MPARVPGEKPNMVSASVLAATIAPPPSTTTAASGISRTTASTSSAGLAVTSGPLVGTVIGVVGVIGVAGPSAHGWPRTESLLRTPASPALRPTRALRPRSMP